MASEKSLRYVSDMKLILKKTMMPRFADFLFLLVFLGALMSGPTMLNIDGDLPRHLLVGKVVLETGVAPTQEIFSYVYENKPYTPHEWLADVIYYVLYLLFGLNGVVLLASLLIAITFGLIYSEASRQNDRPFLTFLLMMLGAFVTSIHWITRPHLFTMLFLAIWIILIDRLCRGTAVKLWVFPALVLFWANIHAEFIAGFLVLFAYIAGCVWQILFQGSKTALKTVKHLLTITLSSFTVSLINPVGLRTWDVVVGYVNNRYLLSRIVETQPPDFTQAEYFPLLLLLGIAAFLLVTKRDLFAPAHYFLLAGFGLMSLLSARNAHLAGVVFPFVLSRALAGIKSFKSFERLEATIRRMDSQSTGILGVTVSALLITALVIAGPLGKLNRYEPAVFPVEAVQWLESNPQSGRMFNAFDWGGYILFHLWPDQKTFIESQTDVTGEATQKYERVITLQDGWQDIFDEYDITWALIPPDWPLATELLRQGWETAYQDQTALILVKD
jgi:hypothetical protein